VSSPTKTKTKKVQAYPIKGLITQGAAKKPLLILKINREGLLASLGNVLVHVGEYYEVEFELPAIKHIIHGQMRVFKTYDRATPVTSQSTKVERVAEFRYQNLPPAQVSAIAIFLRALGPQR
jgi:hypothetical protein